MSARSSMAGPGSEETHVTDIDARAILLAAARSLAREDDLATGLQAILDATAEALGVASAAIVMRDRASGTLEIVASFGLDAAAAAGLTEAMKRSTHPVTRTFEETSPTYDVAPTVPGGPALRSHLPLTVIRHGDATVLGVLALAHDDPIEPETRPIIEAAADLAAVAIERHRSA
jgi:GAF domain-containing protein